MNLDARVLRATYRLAQRQKTVRESEIAQRLGETHEAVCASMRRLQSAGLTETRSDGARRLTMTGLAIALALPSARTLAATRSGAFASRAA